MLAEFLHGVGHFIDRKLLADHVEIKLCAAANDDLTTRHIGELHGVADHVPPRPRHGRDEQYVVDAFGDFQTIENRGVGTYRAVIRHESILKWYEFKVNAVVQHQFHRLGFGPGLKRQKAFRGQVGIDVNQGTGH